MTRPGIYLVRLAMGLVMLEVFIVLTVMMTMAVMMVTGDSGWVVDGDSGCVCDNHRDVGVGDW